MQIKSRLAIVIPAYKGDYLEKTLDSIANQTCKEFVLYIGDDQSPDNLSEIIDKYCDKINIIYEKFEDNLGSVNLVGQWSRCVNLTRNEEWIWLFSDDDVMDENCVEKFYDFVNNNGTAGLLHFDIDIIDKNSSIIKSGVEFPDKLKVEDFFYKRIKNQINTTVVEYVFKKSLYDDSNGFQNYDLAWCTDDATWIKFGISGGITSIKGAKIKWRDSGTNISAISDDKSIVIRKLKSNIIHIKWIKTYFNKQNLHDYSSDFEKFKWVTSGFLLTSVYSLREKYKFSLSVINQLEYSRIKLFCLIFVFYIHFKKK